MLFTDEMQLIEHVDEVYLIRLFNLGLDDRAKPVVELLDQKSIAPFIDIFQDALIGFFVGDSVRMEGSEILFVLLIERLLVEHKESCVLVSGTHDSRPLVQCG